MAKTFWEKQITKAQVIVCSRTIHQSRTNPDYIMKHPAECRGNPEKKILSHPHPEAKKRVLHELKLKTSNSFMPATQHFARMNKNG